MSYGVSLTISTGQGLHEVYETNYTHNCGPMFSLAITKAIDNGKVYSLSDLHDYSANDVCVILDGAVSHMEHNKDQYLPLTPKNGWGDYDGAKNWLKDIAYNCHKYHCCTLKVN